MKKKSMKLRGNFIVTSFDLYRKMCDWRYDEYCGTYSHEDKVKCARENCPFALYFFDEINVEEKEPYKDKLTYIV